MNTATPLQARGTWRVLAWCAVAAFAAFRLPELTRYSLWYDELFSFTLAQQDWGEVLRRAIADRTNPPLFYATLKLWMAVGGESVAWMRLLPCAAGILAAIPLVALVRRWTDDLPTAFVVVAIGAASPLAVFLSNELRGYSLLLLLTALSYVTYLRLADDGGHEAGAGATAAGDAVPTAEGTPRPGRGHRTAAFAAVSVALVYTHYFGWLVIASELGAALFWHRRALARVTGVALVTAIAFAPWVIAVRQGAAGAVAPLSNVDWISVPTVRDIPTFYDALIARVLTPRTAWIGAVALLVPLGLLALRTARRPPRAAPANPADVPAGGMRGAARPSAAVCLAWLAGFPVVAAFVASLVTHRSVFVPRYLIIAAPSWWIVVGMAMTRADVPRRAWTRSAAAAAAFAVFTMTAGTLREVRGGEKIDWERLVRAIAADAGPRGGTVYSLEGFTALPSAYYAATLETGLAVRPARDLAAMTPPAWLVVRTDAGHAAASLGAALQIRGRSLTPVAADTVPSHAITVYRVGTP